MGISSCPLTPISPHSLCPQGVVDSVYKYMYLYACMFVGSYPHRVYMAWYIPLFGVYVVGLVSWVPFRNRQALRRRGFHPTPAFSPLENISPQKLKKGWGGDVCLCRHFFIVAFVPPYCSSPLVFLACFTATITVAVNLTHLCSLSCCAGCIVNKIDRATLH